MRQHAGIVLKRFGLERQQAWNMSVADLSGGQKARVNFAFLSLCPAHVLILDEPTNHLDASGLEHLSEALESFEGGVVVISHDELLIRRILASSRHSELLICGNGQIQRCESGLHSFDEYQRSAFEEQYRRAEVAENAASRRLQHLPSTREPTPDPHLHDPIPPAQPQTDRQRNLVPEDALEKLFSRAKQKKAKPVSRQQ